MQVTVFFRGVLIQVEGRRSRTIVRRTVCRGIRNVTKRMGIADNQKSTERRSQLHAARKKKKGDLVRREERS